MILTNLYFLQMKKICILALLLSNFTVFAQEFKSAVDYLNYISKEQTAISASTWKYTSAVAHSKSARRIENTRKQLIKSIQTAKTKIAAIQNGYNGNLDYQNAVIQYFDFCEKNLKEEYDKIINMQDVAEKSYDAMEAYLIARDLISEKLNSEGEKSQNAFASFALKNNISVNTSAENELVKKINLSNEVFEYHTKIYLIFFKSNFTDNTLFAAIKNKDMAAIQQNANALVQYANEGLLKLKAVPAFKGDSSLIQITRKALEFYKKQAEIFVPKIIDYYMFNDKFENAKKVMEAKTQSSRTQVEVDNFNGMVKQINEQVNNYNKQNATNFQEKGNLLNEWTVTGENFISKYVPND